MRVLRALSLVAFTGVASAALACETHTIANAETSEVKIIALLDEPLLLNSASDQGARLRIAERALTDASEEPVLLNSVFPTDDTTIASDWIDLEALPHVAALSNMPPVRVVVDDEGYPLLDVTATASVVMDVWALDGFEDR
jgi:hypothetical protein